MLINNCLFKCYAKNFLKRIIVGRGGLEVVRRGVERMKNKIFPSPSQQLLLIYIFNNLSLKGLVVQLLSTFYTFIVKKTLKKISNQGYLFFLQPFLIKIFLFDQVL